VDEILGVGPISAVVILYLHQYYIPASGRQVRQEARNQLIEPAIHGSEIPLVGASQM